MDRDQNEPRNAILAGEEARLTLRRENYYDEAKNSWLATRAVVELSTKARNGRWVTHITNIDKNGDLAQLLANFASWFAQRTVEFVDERAAS